MRVAVVGAGPAGMYAAGHLLGSPGGTYIDGRLVQLTDMPVAVLFVLAATSIGV